MAIYARSLRAGIPAYALAVIVFLWFRDKAFNVDDVTFLTMADHMLEDPLHPASVQIAMNGTPPQWISNGMWSGPVMPALLVPSVAAGGAEWLAHLVMLAVFLLGLLATGAFALRLGLSDASTRWAVLLTATSPAVLAMASTSMPDVPTMSFAALGAERLLAYRDHRGLWRAVVAALALALCILSRQHGLLVLGCLLPIMWSGSLRDRMFLSTVATMVAAVAIVLVVYAVMRDTHADDSLAATPLQAVNFHRWRVNLANLPAQWVLSFPLGIAWTWLHGRRMVRSIACWIAALAGAYCAYQTHLVYTHLEWLWWQAPITALGAAVLADIVADAIRRRDPIELGLAAWLFIALPMAVYSHLPPKYFVPAAPAMATLILRHAPTTRLLAVTVTICATLGLLIIRADEQHAEIGRRGGGVVASYVQRGEKVWFDGAWGFHWYAMRAGAHPMTSADPKPQPGDVVVAGTEGWMIYQWKNKTMLDKLVFESSSGRIFERPAGFYSNVAWGPLPWRWSTKPYKPITVWRIE